MRIIEEYTEGRTPGWPNEDRYAVTADFAAVIDGAGDPPRRSWRGKPIGWHAARIVAEVLPSLDPGVSAVEAVAEMTGALRQLSSRMAADGLGPPNPAANLVMYTRRQRAIWRVGDCPFRIDDENHSKPPKDFEATLIKVRQLIFSAGREAGYGVAKMDADVSHIYEILYSYQELCQNRDGRHPFSFPVLDGRDVSKADIEILEIGIDRREIVLASDGYPVLKSTLAASEQALAEIVADDPLLIGSDGKTKAPRGGGIAYDDRTYLRIGL